jgi:hypothetical protein
MPSKLSEFLSDVSSAKAKGDAADAEVVSKLKGLSPEDFARVPRDVLGDLSSAQYTDIVGSIAPDVKLNKPKAKPTVVRRQTRSLRDYWTWIPLPVVAVAASVALGMTILFAAIITTPLLEWWSYSKPLTLPAHVAEWPRCARLSRWTDGCVYRVTKILPWKDAAGYLDLPESFLRRLNHHIADDPIPAGTDLTVWRERFLLGEDR